MSRTVYLNGAYVREEDAKISIFDRGFLMADAVYEVTAVLDGKLIDFDGHVARLRRSMAELDMPLPDVLGDLREVHHRLVKENGLVDGVIYLQISRGNPGDRDFAFPVAAQTPLTVVLFTQSKPGLATTPSANRGLRVISVPDRRWGRRDIKTTQLLYPSLCKMKAKKAGADDAWLVEDGYITEGTSSNAWIIQGKTLVTRSATREILHGITRAAVIKLTETAGLSLEERAFTLDEAKSADEAFVTSAAAFVMPVVQIDDAVIGNGKPGPLVIRLRALYLEGANKAAT